MRFLITSLTLVAVMCLGPLALPALALAQGQPVEGQLDVDINTNNGGAWWTNPLWIAIGVIVLVLIIALIVMASRSTTTVIKE